MVARRTQSERMNPSHLDGGIFPRPNTSMAPQCSSGQQVSQDTQAMPVRVRPFGVVYCTSILPSSPYRFIARQPHRSAIPPIPFRAKYAWRSSRLGQADGRTEAIPRCLIVGTEVAAAAAVERGRVGAKRRSQS